MRHTYTQALPACTAQDSYIFAFFPVPGNFHRSFSQKKQGIFCCCWNKKSTNTCKQSGQLRRDASTRPQLLQNHLICIKSWTWNILFIPSSKHGCKIDYKSLPWLAFITSTGGHPDQSKSNLQGEPLLTISNTHAASINLKIKTRWLYFLSFLMKQWNLWW